MALASRSVVRASSACEATRIGASVLYMTRSHAVPSCRTMPAGITPKQIPAGGSDSKSTSLSPEHRWLSAVDERAKRREGERRCEGLAGKQVGAAPWRSGEAR